MTSVLEHLPSFLFLTSLQTCWGLYSLVLYFVSILDCKRDRRDKFKEGKYWRHITANRPNSTHAVLIWIGTDDEGFGSWPLSDPRSRNSWAFASKSVVLSIATNWNAAGSVDSCKRQESRTQPSRHNERNILEIWAHWQKWKPKQIMKGSPQRTMHVQICKSLLLKFYNQSFFISHNKWVTVADEKSYVSRWKSNAFHHRKNALPSVWSRNDASSSLHSRTVNDWTSQSQFCGIKTGISTWHRRNYAVTPLSTTSTTRTIDQRAQARAKAQYIEKLPARLQFISNPAVLFTSVRSQFLSFWTCP